MPKGHKLNCSCFICKAKRGEMKGKNSGMYKRKKKLEEIKKIRKGNLGQKRSLKTIEKMRKSATDRKQSKEMIAKVSGEKSKRWKGDNITYHSKHARIQKIKGNANKYKCIGDGINRCNKQARDWSNKDHIYSLNPNDYFPRCRGCHIKYDNIFNKQNII